MARCASGCSKVSPVSPRWPKIPGFDVVTLDPLILPALSPVAAWHDCRHGRIEAGWVLEGDTVTYTRHPAAGRTRPSAAEPATAATCTIDGTARHGPKPACWPPGTHTITFRI